MRHASRPAAAKLAAPKTAASKADYSRPRQTMADQSILISAVLPASLMPLFVLQYGALIKENITFSGRGSLFFRGAGRASLVFIHFCPNFSLVCETLTNNQFKHMWTVWRFQCIWIRKVIFRVKVVTTLNPAVSEVDFNLWLWLNLELCNLIVKNVRGQFQSCIDVALISISIHLNIKSSSRAIYIQHQIIID